MSAALVELIVPSSQAAVGKPEVVPAATAIPRFQREDLHPLAPVFAIGALALIGALAFVGSIMMWLALRHSGVLAP